MNSGDIRKKIIGPSDAEPREAARAIDGDASLEDAVYGATLRPRTFEDYVGQRQIVENLRIAIDASKRRGEPLEHVLFSGPPGLGKTTLANLIAKELGGTLHGSSGPTLEKPKDLVGILTALDAGDVLFIDEIHRLGAVVEEYLYPAMEDFQIDFVVDRGAYAKTLKLPLKRFTLVGATTRAGMLSAPLRDRFGLMYHLDYYEPDELQHIVERSARVLDVRVEPAGAATIAKRSRGTPRIANRLLRRVRDFAEVRADGVVTGAVADEALAREGVDERGLDRLDRAYLRTIAEGYGGGPVGINAIAATLTEDLETLEDVVEPYLLKIGFVQRTANGRKTTAAAFAHLGMIAPSGSDQPGLFFVIGRALFLKSLLVATGGLDIWEPPDPELPSSPPTLPPLRQPGGTIVRVQLPDRSIATLDVEKYLYGVVALESPPSWPAAALQAQAIVARTYAMQKRTLSRAYDLVANDSDQRYGGPGAEHPATTAAVDATRGQTLTYLGGPASVFYSACCGGHSADADVLWGHAGLAYLRGVDDPYCTAAPDYRWQRSLPFDRARAALADKFAGMPTVAQLNDPDDSGRPQTVTFRGDGGTALALSVSEVRRRFGADTVRSLWLRQIAFDRTQAVPLVVIEGSGRGHGVGLCQWGSRGMALQGADASAILAHFFPGTAVTGG